MLFRIMRVCCVLTRQSDLILLETLSLVRGSTYATVEALMATGLPVWISFRRVTAS